MKNKLCCNPVRLRRATSRQGLFLLLWIVILAGAPRALAGDAPPWMHSLVNAPLPHYDEKTDAVLLYSETNLTVLSADKFKTHVREAYKILRPEGREYGTVFVYFNSHRKVTSIHGWCIPAQGKDFEVKDATEVAPPNVPGGELIVDVKAKVLQIPAPAPGNIIGYEYEVEEQPFILQDTWYLQQTAPVRQSLYSVQLPPGWEYKASWFNHPETKAATATNNQWNWAVSDVEGIRKEDEMPPMRGVAAQMTLSLFPPGGAVLNEFTTWQGMGAWYLNLTSGRRDASPEIKEQVGVLTASAHTPLEKMQAIAQFIQRDIRYVAIELGIGGWQPHPATDVFSHRYGDCKDKATLTAAMLNEIGIESYYVLINMKRGSVGPDTPARAEFEHAILAIKLPPGPTDPSLIATLQDPKLGKLLFFDPTNEFTPFGQIGGYLQSNYGLLVSPDGSALVELPQQPAINNSVQRTAKLILDASGKLQGDVKEVRFGDRARSERRALRSTTKSTDQIKPIENVLATSLSTFRITKASIVNLQLMDQPFGFNYSFESENYAKNAGGLLLLRPRVLGVKSEALLETKEPRKFPIEFPAPVRDTDTFEIALPPGYEVDDLPPPVDADYSFASYHSKTEATGAAIRYTRTFEIKELSVPVSKAEELKMFYRIIATDERNTAVLKLSAK
jgi:hypothetical protein